MLLYNIYKNITEEQFVQIKEQLFEFGLLITPLFIKNDFSLEEEKFPEGLGLGWKKNYDKFNDGIFQGGVGISYDDFPGEPTFSLHLIKTYDVEKGRYSHIETIQASFTLTELQKNYSKWLVKAISRYNLINKKDLTDYIEFTKL